MKGRRAICVALASLLFAIAIDSASAAGPASALDSRAWEVVSPADKNGGEVGALGSEGAGVVQAAKGGGALAFGSETSFGSAEGAAPVSQYLAVRGASAWATQNLTPPLLSGTYEAGAYLGFSTDLSRALLTNGWRCPGGEAQCAAANPPLGPSAPPGYRNLYLRQGGGYQPLITETNFPALPAAPEDFQLSFEGASPDLTHIALSADEGLYIWSAGQLTLLDPTPGATLAARAGAISDDGSRVYFRAGGNLYLHQGAETLQVDEGQGGGGEFQTASGDGSIAFFTKEGHVYRYDAADEEATDLTPGGEVLGVLGASSEGSHLYYLSAFGLQLWQEGTTTKVAAAADASNYPPATGTARITPGGSRLAFLSTASLTGYANVGKVEVFIYEAPAKRLLCASCNPKGSTPAGPSTIPGALGPDGGLPYKPRALTEDGSRLFFDSADALLISDTDKAPDVYQWEAKGIGGCTKTAGCIGLVSGGRVGGAQFADASTDGTDAYFATATPLLPADTAENDLDLYDARAGGGFPEPSPPILCEGDDCQGPPPGPDDPSPGTAALGAPGNPPLRIAGKRKRPRPRPQHKHHGKRHRHHKHHRGQRRGGR